MAKGKNEEQEFLKRVDAMLAGGEGIGDAGDASVADDVRGAVEFASKLIDLHDGPTAEFSQRLKSRLLVKLTEQDEMARARSERSGFRRLLASLVPASAVWRSAAVSLVLVVAVVTVLWRTGMFTGTVGPDTAVQEAVTAQLSQRAVAPQAASEKAVEATADAGVAVTSMAAPAPAPAAAEMAAAGGGMTVTVGEVTVEMLKNQVLAPGIDIEVAVYAGPALSVEVVVVASYSIDGGPPVTATDPSSRFLASGEGINLSWTGLGLATSDGTTLIFSIDRIGEHEGPWMFKIPLRD